MIELTTLEYFINLTAILFQLKYRMWFMINIDLYASFVVSSHNTLSR